MSAHRLKPKNDFLFKRLFGESDSKHLLIPLLNAILGATSRRSIADVTVIDNKELVKQVLDGKSGRLDVRCESDRSEQINLEVQIERELAMDKRSLFYAGTMYTGSIKEGNDYAQLKKTIAINILDFDFLPSAHFHSTGVDCDGRFHQIRGGTTGMVKQRRENKAALRSARRSAV
ncbi:Rpn family recombination-promoting nuclease/putative transposase [Cohnella cellulosilytica]|uniref:Rpn family recombination-promoting nuclease/putative transposase n=1 Tax=Cohnella cellulosilytica TaxID=986710 RepID=A0ABW2F7Q1_9BACL